MGNFLPILPTCIISPGNFLSRLRNELFGYVERRYSVRLLPGYAQLHHVRIYNNSSKSVTWTWVGRADEHNKFTEPPNSVSVLGKLTDDYGNILPRTRLSLSVLPENEGSGREIDIYSLEENSNSIWMDRLVFDVVQCRDGDTNVFITDEDKHVGG